MRKILGIIGFLVLTTGGLVFGQNTSPGKAVRDLTSKDATLQLNAQEEILTALGDRNSAARGQMIASIKAAAKGPDAMKTGPRALAMMGLALTRDRSAQDLIDAIEDAYRSAQSAGVRGVAVYQLMENAKAPGAMQALRRIARDPVDKADHRSMVRQMGGAGAPELRSLAIEMNTNRWVKDHIAAAELRRILRSGTRNVNK